MDTNVRRRRLHKEIIVNTSNSYYTHDVSMFLEPPSFEIALQEFQELAIERLQLLRIIEQASLKGHKMFSEDWKQCIKEDLNKEGLKKYVRLLNGVEGNSEADILARRDAIKLLIMLYEQQTALHDRTSPLYKNKEARQAKLCKIHKDFCEKFPGASIVDIKKKIHILRTQFFAEHKKSLMTDAVNKSSWWCYNLLMFLDTNRVSNGTIQIQPKIEYDDEAEPEVHEECIFLSNLRETSAIDTLSTSTTSSVKEKEIINDNKEPDHFEVFSKADHISHYILQLAYCRSDDLRRWFLFREVEWFKLKFLSQSPKSITHFLKINNLVYSPISPEEKEHYKRELIASTPLLKDVSCETTDFYKVPFTEVAPLVKTRRVYLRKGYAYIQMSDLVVCIQAKFRAALSERLNIFSHRLPTMDDDRLNSLLRNLHSAETGRNYAIREDKDAVDPALLDEYSKKHYPLCMRHMHEALRSIHKLKHWGRLQYGLFLKGIGLLYEDAMNFWQQEFTKIMDSNHFQKNYTYNVKHNYGKVGNRVNYTPCSCMKIITQNVGPGDYHGCPFKHWNPAMLKQKILEYGISTEGAQAVMELVSNGHYQIACSKYFEYAHGTAPANFINHPNQYFDESMNLTKEKQSKKP